MTMEKTHFEDTLAADIQLIKDTVLDYIEAWYEGDAPRGEKSLHPQLAKRIVRRHQETGEDYLEMMSASALAARWQSGDGKATPQEKQLRTISVLDIYGHMASVKLEATAWVDYMHLAKYNGKWSIINILWALKP